MDFQLFRKEKELADDVQELSCTIQELVKGIISYDRYAEMYANNFPNFIGVISVPIEGEEETFQSVGIYRGKVIYSAEAVIAGKFRISPVFDLVGIGEDGENLWVEKVNNSCYLLHAEGNSASPFEFSSEDDAKQMAEMLSVFRMESRISKEDL